jgi:catechol 2,3-dioxygenase-like lactoylglutathione lyase family enzyme
VLGRFLEWSIATADIRASLDFYSKLGFSQAAVGEAWVHPYAVVTDGRICLGLHQEPAFAPSLTFVKPDLLKHLDTLETLRAEYQLRRLGNDVFNELAWPDPAGHLIRLVEARTFSPNRHAAKRQSLCGYFLEIALPTPSLDLAKAYWEACGFVGMDEPESPLPHISCTSDTVDIGLYEPAHLREPMLCFEVEDVAATRSNLDALGLTPAQGRVPAPLRGSSAMALSAPEGTAILMTCAARR